LEETSKIIKSNCQPITTIPKCHLYTFFEPLQGWGLPHCPGQPVPMPDHSFSEEIFPNIQSEPPLTQLEAIASRPVTGYLGEEINSLLTTISDSCRRVVRPWPRLPREAVAAPSLAALKARLDGALSTLGWWKMSLLMAGGGNWMSFKVPSNTNRSVIL